VGLAANPDLEPIGIVVAAIALVAVDAAHRDPGDLFEIGDDGTKGMAVIRVAVQRLGVQHELPAPESEVRARSGQFIEELLRGELDAVLARPRYGRSQMAGNEGRASVAGHRHGSRTRSLTGTFGPIEIAVPRARLATSEGKTAEWKSHARCGPISGAHLPPTR
jgi:hypothetical protein